MTDEKPERERMMGARDKHPRLIDISIDVHELWKCGFGDGWRAAKEDVANTMDKKADNGNYIGQPNKLPIGDDIATDELPHADFPETAFDKWWVEYYEHGGRPVAIECAKWGWAQSQLLKSTNSSKISSCAELQAELNEQCRLLGMSGSREAKLLAEKEATEKINLVLNDQLDKAQAELRILKDPSDGRCMEIAALRDHRANLERELRLETERADQNFDTLRHMAAQIEQLERERDEIARELHFAYEYQSELRATLELVRSQMCWERDRDQLTMGMQELHGTVTKALEIKT